jgi:predicted house-cleaning noncanonical NTP pyrophosphatase (MazG superfamily)
MKHNKLVRDKIPQIIEHDGKEAIIRVLSEEDFQTELKRKLSEEVMEYSNKPSLEELADILEIIYASAGVLGSTIIELETLRKQKVQERGSFHKKIFLEEVKE